tara:strand:+ start:15450 stop:16307 length:858 start_codon:yes stop_codon:yes gene_type:complete
LKLLVTGSGTLLGNNVVLEACKSHDIFASYRKSFPKNLKKKNISLIKLDLEKEFKLDLKVDCLIHCASAIPSENLSDKRMMKTNYYGFKRLALQLIKKGCKKIIFISSISVYGDIKGNKIDLNTKIMPTDIYGNSKLKVEEFLKKLQRNNKIDFFILRLPALVGGKSDHDFISKTLKKIKKNEIVTYSNPNLKFNNFVHVKNLTSIILKLIKINESRILNIASSRPIKLKNIIKSMFNFEKKNDNSKIQQSNKKGFSIKIDNYLKKNFKIFSTKNTLKLFLRDKS